MIDPEEKRTPFLWPPEDCKVFWRHAQLPETSRRSHGQIFEVLLYRDNPALSQSWWCDVSFLVFLDNLKLRGYFDQMFLPFFYEWQCQVWTGVESSPGQPFASANQPLNRNGSNRFKHLCSNSSCENLWQWLSVWLCVLRPQRCFVVLLRNALGSLNGVFRRPAFM